MATKDLISPGTVAQTSPHALDPRFHSARGKPETKEGSCAASGLLCARHYGISHLSTWSAARLMYPRFQMPPATTAFRMCPQSRVDRQDRNLTTSRLIDSRSVATGPKRKSKSNIGYWRMENLKEKGKLCFVHKAPSSCVSNRVLWTSTLSLRFHITISPSCAPSSDL